MHAKLKILIPWYMYPPFTEHRTGGLSVALWELSQNLAELGHDVEVLTPKIPSSAQEQETIYQQRVHVHHCELGNKIFRGSKLDANDRKFLGTYDHILSIENFGSKSLANVKGLNVSRQIHTIARDRPLSSYLSLSPSPQEYLKMIAAKNKLVRSESRLAGIRSICVSRYVLQKMLDYKLEPAKNLAYVPNGIDTRRFFPKKKDLQYDILHIGRFQKVKGVDVLIQSLNLLEKKGVCYQLGVAGDFTLQERQFCLSIAREEVRANIKFIGHIAHESLPEVLNASRLLVAPSIYESFCLPVLEAIACGVPVVASNVGGIRELVEEGTGIMVEPGDPNALSHGILKALKDDSLVNEAKVRGPSRVKREYDWSIVAPRFVESL